jgi:stress response protein YsnF
MSSAAKNSTNYSNKSETIGQITNIIPVMEESFELFKKTTREETKIEKRWVTKTEKIEVPLNYEELYVNDKIIKEAYEEQSSSSNIGKEIGEKFSKIKDTIIHGIHGDEKNEEEQKEENMTRTVNQVPLFESSRRGKHHDNSNINDQETEKTIPIWGEQIVISKKMVKLGEIIIKKSRIVEKKNIDIEIAKEKVSIEYPDGRKEQIVTPKSSSGE